MRESPRSRRLKSDLKSLEQLAAESSIFSFERYGTPPDFYILRFRGRGVCRPSPDEDPVLRDEHEVHVRLGASYPRMMPELAWKSPIFHPNISASGVVCLGGYGTYWVPSLALDELCMMLWDMIRYENYDETSPYNREAAAWAKNQTRLRLPIDNRPLRNKLAQKTAINDLLPPISISPPARSLAGKSTHGSSPFRAQPPEPIAPPARPRSQVAAPAEVMFIGEVVEAQVVPSRGSGDGEILFIE